MKKLHNTFCVIWLLMTAIPAIAGGPEFDIHKEKTISKAYIVNADAGININNKYGNVYVTTWDESKIAIDVVIKVSGKKEDAVNKLLNSITVDLNALTNMVTAKTVFSSNSPRNTSMEINYTIRIPKRGSIKIDNQYGSIIADKINGKSDIDCKYGNITIAELNNADNTIDLQYCNSSSIGNIKNGRIDAKYSGLAISKAGNLAIDIDYTNLKIKDAGNINYSASYGELNIGEMDNLNGSGNYLTLNFGTVNGSCSINTNYSALNVAKLTAKSKNVAITANYTNINIKYDADYAFEFDFVFKYASLDASGLTFQSKRESTSSNTYRGFYKSTNANKMSIVNGYGDVKLTKI